jgi:cell division protein ZapA
MATATRQNPVKDTNNGSVRVEIFDQAYNLRGSDADYIIKLADYVDSKMRAVAEQTNTIDTVRLAVLAALNIADEFHLLRRKLDGKDKDNGSNYRQRAHKLANALDEVLAEPRKAG